MTTVIIIGIVLFGIGLFLTFLRKRHIDPGRAGNNGASRIFGRNATITDFTVPASKGRLIVRSIIALFVSFVSFLAIGIDMAQTWEGYKIIMFVVSVIFLMIFVINLVLLARHIWKGRC